MLKLDCLNARLTEMVNQVNPKELTSVSHFDISSPRHSCDLQSPQDSSAAEESLGPKTPESKSETESPEVVDAGDTLSGSEPQENKDAIDVQPQALFEAPPIEQKEDDANTSDEFEFANGINLIAQDKEKQDTPPKQEAHAEPDVRTECTPLMVGNVAAGKTKSEPSHGAEVIKEVGSADSQAKDPQELAHEASEKVAERAAMEICSANPGSYFTSEQKDKVKAHVMHHGAKAVYTGWLKMTRKEQETTATTLYREVEGCSAPRDFQKDDGQLAAVIKPSGHKK